MQFPTEARAALDRGLATGTAPGLVALIGSRDDQSPIVAAGLRKLGGDAVTPDTRYDLASLSKVTATLPSVLRLVSDGEITLDDRIGRFFANAGWFQQPSLADVTVRQLLAHASGLPAWRPLFAEMNDRRVALAAVLQTPLERPPGGPAVYSDLGFMLLGALVERVSGDRLDRFAQAHVFTPLGMTTVGYGPLHGVAVAATENCGWRGRLLEGEVHDENATVWDGVAGHAGLFGTVADMGRYARAWLELDGRLGREEVLAEALCDAARTESGVRRGLGWQLASDGCFSGEGARGFGHTGFTGTSLWIDPERDRWAVLLSNRVHPDRGGPEAIHHLRTAFHEALWRAL